VRVGLTGGIGSGESAVAALLREFGAWVVDTDQLAREATAPGSQALREIAANWPQVVRGAQLDRAALAAIVFKDAQARARLNAIVHPQVRRLALERESAAGTGAIAVHVVPLLFETGYADLVDRSVLVAAPDAQRLARIMSRDSLDEAAARARMQAQIAPETARSRADYVIENDAGPAELRTRARAVYEALLSEAAKSGGSAGPPAGQPYLGDS
jgi:dephospho-CoA kinase